MLKIGFLIITVFSTFLSYNLYQSAGQLIQDKSNSSVYAVLGSSLLIESSDPILTDRGGYFNKTQFIQLNPNFISSSVPDLQDELVILALIKIIEPGVIFSMQVEGTQRIAISFDSGSLYFSRGGYSVDFIINTCKIYLAEWVKVIIGYVGYLAGPCASSGLIIQINGVCKSLFVNSYRIKWSTDSVVKFGATSESFTGFLGLFNAYSDYDTANSLVSTLVNLDSNPYLYFTSMNISCTCDSYSCDSNDSNICIKCNSTCKDFCNDFNSNECLDIQVLCGTKIYNSATGTCLDLIGKCIDQVDSSSCNSCEAGYYYNNHESVCLLCHSSCAKCNGPLKSDCICSGPNTHFDLLLEECVCDSGFYNLGGADLSCLGICDQTCLTCSDEMNNFCTSCYDKNFLYNGSCITCDPTCLNCRGSKNTDCISCDESKFLSLGMCIQFDCNEECLTCSDIDKNECKSCRPNYELENGTCLSKTSCGLYCEQKCDETCETCLGSNPTDCLTCKNPNSSVLFPPGECICLDGYYLNNLTSNCELCDKSCLTCSGPTFYDCLICKNSNFITDLPQGQCPCPVEFYPSYESSTCEPCDDSCLYCSSSSKNCSSCQENYILTSNNKCVKCDLGFYLYGDQCEKCHDSCLSCTGYGENSCILCKNSDIIIQSPPGSCSCLESQYISNKNPLVCKDCPLGCKSCNESKCFECFYGFSLNSIQCVKNMFEVKFIVNSNYSISAVFSRKLMKDLNSNDLRITIKSKIVAFTLIKINRSRYLIEIDSYKNTSYNYKVKIEIITKIIAEDKSELSTSIFYCNIKNTSESSDVFDTVVTISTTALLILAFISAIASVFTGFQPTVIWLALNTIQLLSYVPLFNLPLPSILVSFFTSTLPINVLTNIWSKYQILNCDNSDISVKYYEYGFTCHNIITNTGKVLLSFILGLSILIVLLPLYYIPSANFKTFIIKKLTEYKYSFFFRFWIQHFLDVAIPVLISLNFISISGAQEIMNLVFGVIISVNAIQALIIITPVLIIIILKKNYREIKNNDQHIMNKFSPLLREFKNEKNFKVLAYYPIFFIRRIVFSVSAYCLSNFPTTQIGLNCFFTLIVICYFIKIKPFSKQYVNFISIIQEVVILFILTIISFFLSASLGNYETLWVYIVIGCCGSLFVISLMIGISLSIKKIILKLKNIRKHKYKIPASNEENGISNQNIKKIFPENFLKLQAPNNSINENSVFSFIQRRVMTLNNFPT